VGQEIPLVRDITYWLALNGRVGLFVAGMINTENLIYFLVVIAAFLLLSVWRLQAVREKQPGRKKILKLTGLAVGVVVLSYVSSRPFLTWYWDTTATQSNTISVLSQDLLRQLKGELKITTYVNLLDANYESGLPAAHKKDFERFRPYARFKRNLKLDYVISYKRDKLKEYDDEISKWEQFKNTLIMLKEYISAYLPLSPLIEEFANCVEHKKDIEAGNSFRGLLNALGQFLRAFKELIVDGVCWFPRLMRWETSKGEVAPVFSDYKNEGYDYRLKAYMNVVTKEKYSIDSIQEEIKPENRIGTLEQLEQGIVAAEEMVQEVERTRVRGRE